MQHSNTNSEKIRCRICGYNNVSPISKIAEASHLPWVFDCANCGCRFTNHDSEAHENLHQSSSSYDFHDALARKIHRFHSLKQVSRMRRTLSKYAKFKFVIDFIDSQPTSSNIAEFGCSKGYLGAYFIARGYNYTGYDVSKTAVEEATNLFGEHFDTVSQNIAAENLNRTLYDVAFHTGTIGCVENPIDLTNELLKRIRSGGYLIFNAPSKRFLDHSNKIWLETLPPDLVTIFPTNFWEERFSPWADIKVVDNRFSFLKLAKRIFMKKNIPWFHRQEGMTSGISCKRVHPRKTGFINNVLRFLDVVRLDPYGTFVVMKKH